MLIVINLWKVYINFIRFCSSFNSDSGNAESGYLKCFELDTKIWIILCSSVNNYSGKSESAILKFCEIDTEIILYFAVLLSGIPIEQTVDSCSDLNWMKKFIFHCALLLIILEYSSMFTVVIIWTEYRELNCFVLCS